MKLLTFLGANLDSYKTTIYTWKGENLEQRKEEETRFAPIASFKFLDADQLIVFLTQTAKNNVFQAFIEDANKKNIYQITGVDIPDGNTEEQLWQIFSAVLQQVQPGEELAFDVTHGFRSSPMISLLAAAFMRSAFNVKFKAVFYGAFEAKRGDRTPMYDLTPLITLLEWAVAADRFNRTGDSRYFASLIKEQSDKLDRERYGSAVNALRNLQVNLIKVSRNLHLIRPEDTMKTVAKLEKDIEHASSALEKIMATLPFQALLNSVKQTFEPIACEATPTNLDNAKQILEKESQMIGWYIDRELWMQAAALEREWFISWLMIKNHEFNISDIPTRKKYEEFLGNLKEARSDVQFESDGFIYIPSKDILDRWNTLSDVRNDLMHAGHRKKPRTPKELIDQINKIYEWLKEALTL